MSNFHLGISRERDERDAAESCRRRGHVGAVVQNGDFGVEGEVSKQLGKGVFVAAEGSWFARAGYRAAAMIGWKKKRRTS
jgi:hypothetical protein